MIEKKDFNPNYGTKENSSIIKVIGVGGGGGNAVRHMYSEGIVGVDFLICNTDRQALENNHVPSKLVLGETGLGAGANPNVARELALSSKDNIKTFIGDETKMLFITAGMGKGTGTGASPIVAEIAKEMGILTIGVVTFPFNFEGEKRAQYAQTGIDELRKHVDSLLIIKNQNIMKHYSDATIKTGFGYADDVLKNAVKCIAELITVHAQQNVDFNDISTIMKDSGEAMLGLAVAEGENRIDEVVDQALSSPLLNDGDLIQNAENFLFFITYGSEKELLISELDLLTQKFDTVKNRNANIIWGRAEDESLGAAVKLSVIITNFKKEDDEKEEKNQKNFFEEPEIDEYQTSNRKVEEPKQTPYKNPFDNITRSTTTANQPWDSVNPMKFSNENRPQENDNTPSNSFNYRTNDSTSYGPKMIDNENNSFSNSDLFESLHNTPAFTRSKVNKEATQTATLQQNFIDIDDDAEDFFLKNIPD